MDRALVAARMVEARLVSGLSLEKAARDIGVSAAKLREFEAGGARVPIQVLAKLGSQTGRSLAYFIEPPVQAVVSRRRSATDAHISSQQLDVELDQFSIDVRMLAEMSLLNGIGRDPSARTPRTTSAAESFAQSLRRRLGVDSAPLADMMSLLDSLGLFVCLMPLGADGPDGACVSIDAGKSPLGVAVVNSQKSVGRVRWTMAHELGHWLFGDAFDRSASVHNESMIDAFVAHFLMPRSGFQAAWGRAQGTDRDRALRLSQEFGVGWLATIAQLRNLGIISYPEHDTLKRGGPGSHIRDPRVDQAVPEVQISAAVLSACEAGLADGILTRDRAAEIARVSLHEVPPVDADALDKEYLEASFKGHSFDA